MAINRWEPFTQATTLRDAMNRLFEESIVRPNGTTGAGTAAALDVYEDGECYVVELALPGVRPEDVEVSVLGNTLTIRGTWPARVEGRQYLHGERASGRFERTITLPSELNRDRIEARTEHGVLHLTLPKAETARPRRIEVKVGQ